MRYVLYVVIIAAVIASGVIAITVINGKNTCNVTQTAGGDATVSVEGDCNVEIHNP